MLFNLFVLIAGLAILIKSADWLVDGSSSIAKKLGVPCIVIGLTVVAFGTSVPELVVNILSSFKGATDLAIGNIIGSNIANIILILGITAIFYPLAINSGTTWKEIPLSLLAAILVFILANDTLIDGTGESVLSHIDGLVLLSFFLIFLYYTYSISRSRTDSKDNIKTYRGWLSLIMICGGIAGLALGGKLAVDSAIKLAEIAGLSQAFIGLTIVAVGTSLPELAASAVAAYKKNPDIAVGNIVGSNIFNIFWILGVSSIIRPLPLTPGMNSSIIVAALATILLFSFMFIGKRHILERWQGVGFLICYAGYLLFLISRG
ncbi:MAG: calcium/sodium antiporter [Patescibacteria group bacterium]|nr:calcium/sodium antiporter [Patescibacteria group bacterium]